MSAKKLPAKKAATITPEIAEKFRSAQIANIAKKLQSGKTLTAAEMKLIDDAESQASDRKEKEEKSNIPDVAQSMKQAQAFWGINVAAMRVAKAKGCPAFIQHRIHRDALVEWLEKNPDKGEGANITDHAELKRMKTQGEVELIRAKIDQAKRITIPITEAREETQRCISIGMEEAKGFMEKDHFRVFCERWKSRNGEVMP